jgi:penicillin-binding protein 1A
MSLERGAGHRRSRLLGGPSRQSPARVYATDSGFGPALRTAPQEGKGTSSPQPAVRPGGQRQPSPRGLRPPNRSRTRQGQPPRRKRWLILATLMLPIASVAFALTALFFYFFTAVPLSAEIGSKPTVILDSTGQVEFATLQPQFARKEVPITELCPEGRRHICDAVLAAEDAGFYQHGGVSIPGIVRAALRNMLKGELAQGGSTISQQYIKTVTGDDERTPLRKIREAALAMKLEREYSKDEILELYLNSIYFGRGAYGIQAAAQAYFNRDAKDLDVAQAAQLAGLIPAPSAYDPVENPRAAERRYLYVIDRMLSLGWLDPMAAGELRAEPPETQDREDVRFNDAPFYLDIVRKELERELGDEIYTGLRVTTTLNLAVQKHAQEAYDKAFAGIGPTGALVALDPRTGGIVALIGGENYQTDQFNLAIAPRQAGSTFKPFALAAWIEDDKSPDSYFDAPAKIVLPKADNGKDWTVNNYEKVGYPPLSLREATWKSVNTVYAQVQQQVGPQATARIASQAMGLHGKDAFPPFASLVLGTAEITPLQLAEAYNTFASGGIHRSAFAVIEARRGDEVVYRHKDVGDRVMSDKVAWDVTDVLKGVITNGSGWRARVDRVAAGKTGTTQDHADAWFAGYTPALTAVVWMGNRDNNLAMPGKPTGGDLPAVTWGRFMASTLEGVHAGTFPKPDWDGLIVVRGRPDPSPDAEDVVECDSGQIEVDVSGDEEAGYDVSEDEEHTTQTGCLDVTDPDESASSSEPETSDESSEKKDVFGTIDERADRSTRSNVIAPDISFDDEEDGQDLGEWNVQRGRNGNHRGLFDSGDHSGSSQHGADATQVGGWERDDVASSQR